MGMNYNELMREILTLSNKEKATLALTLIDQLYDQTDEHVEKIWAEEAEQRYQAFVAGELDAYPENEVMARAKQRFK